MALVLAFQFHYPKTAASAQCAEDANHEGWPYGTSYVRSVVALESLLLRPLAAGAVSRQATSIASIRALCPSFRTRRRAAFLRTFAGGRRAGRQRAKAIRDETSNRTPKAAMRAR